MSDNSLTFDMENESISSQQINEAEFLIEETLKPISELDFEIEIAPE